MGCCRVQVNSLAKLMRWTRPGGWLVLSVPNAGSYEFKIFRDMWYALQLPTHLTHFTPKTIEQMLSRAGWRPENIFHHQNVNNLIASLRRNKRQQRIVATTLQSLKELQKVAG